MNLIKNNVELQENSFLYKLHESSEFSIDMLEKITGEIVELVKRSVDLSDLDIILYSQALFFIYKMATTNIIYHFNPNDLYRVNDLDKDYQLYLDRFSFSLEMFLKRDYESINDYVDELGSLV